MTELNLTESCIMIMHHNAQFRISQMEERIFLSELMVQDESKIIPLTYGGQLF